jgi:hypothetical protein
MSDYIALDVAYTSKAIDAMLAAYPELLGDDEELRLDSLDGETNLVSLLSRLVKQRNEREALAEGLNLYITKLIERRDRFSRGADGLKGLILRLMATAELPKLELPEATLHVGKGRVSVSVTDVDSLPQGTFKLVRQPDKVAIKKELEAGSYVPGAALVTGENTLTVRVK